MSAAVCALAWVAGSAFAPPIVAAFDQPAVDRWMYPFGGTPGSEEFARLFGSTSDPKFADVFDNRDGQMYLRFDTFDEIPSGLGREQYEIISARLTLRAQSDLAYIYDDTVDPYEVFLLADDPDHVADEDPGQPIEVFGAGFRNGFTAASFPENGPFASGSAFGQGVRNVFALGFDAAGEAIDVSNNVAEAFTPQPWAVGLVDGLDPGDLVPVDAAIELDLDIADPFVRSYLQQSLSDGRVALCATSLHIVEIMSGSFPTIYCKEHTLVQFGLADAARLDVTVNIAADVIGDLNSDGLVDGADLGTLLLAWGPCGRAECPADIDASGEVDGADLGVLLLNWS